MPETKETKSIQVNLRCTYEEEEALRAACEAVPLTISRLVEIGVTQAVTDLGMALLDDAAPRLRPDYVWPFAPARPEGESAKTRLTAYIPADLYPTLETAAWAVRLSIPFFSIGAALREVALLKLMNERRKPPKHNAALAKVALPYKFDDLVRTTRR